MTHASLLTKICGLSTPETLIAALDAGADMIGLVQFPPSPRHVDLGKAAELAALARGRASVVVLTVNPDDALIDAILKAVSPDFIQLHGKETVDRVAEVRRRIPVIKALGIATAEDVAAARAYDGAADYLLLDAKPPKDATRPGGLGQAFDWSLLDSFKVGTSVLLSGGLHPTNVAEAISRVRPEGVDVSSGVESAPGVKDKAKIEAFLINARAAAGSMR
ncbi:phosphoribosylanthranilate isomerase [Oryzibacter oryziterrae]|uniref:phosphoribosylanthranilate isomerase n=1 Tax=Oryzibacter oryziterrae TaxID=2766474 RepID=UPI001F02A0E9|nr:phosphoribosylanthranilate isomerase [Oryzibacter oryziterrae]